MYAGWWVELEGEESYLRDLAMSFNGPRLRVVEEGDAFYATASEFATLTLPDDVRERARELVAIACGSVELELGRFRPPRVVAAIKVDGGGAKQHFVTVSSELRFRSEIHGRVERTLSDGSIEVVDLLPNSPRPEEWLKLALADSEIADALAILGREDLRWHDLFHVYEIVKDEAGDGIFANGWATKAAVERFTQTSNSRRAIGREARHGHDRFAAPKQPMDLAEARKLVVTIVRGWLEAKAPPPPLREVVVEVRPSERGATFNDTVA